MVFSNGIKYESKLARHRRSFFFNDPGPCLHFFVGGKRPVGFVIGSSNFQYICHKHKQEKPCEKEKQRQQQQQLQQQQQQLLKQPEIPCFFTMFDVNYGIPIYSAYVVKQTQAKGIGDCVRDGKFAIGGEGQVLHIYSMF